MQQYQQQPAGASMGVPVAHLGEDARGEFISKTYMHLAGSHFGVSSAWRCICSVPVSQKPSR